MSTRPTDAGIEFLALASPTRLEAWPCRVEAAMRINWRLACEGRAHPAGEVVVGFGSLPEVEAAICRARAESATPEPVCAVEYSPRRDEARVSGLLEMATHGREQFAAGAADPDGWFPVFVGARAACLREATRLRRVRAGRHGLGGRTP